MTTGGPLPNPLKHSVAQWLTPAARSYIRYSPVATGKEALWNHFFWRPHEYEARCWPGVRVAGNTADMIQRFLYYFGVWEPQVSGWVSTRLAPGDTVIDIGANIGYFSLVASRAVGASGHVLAVEPAPRAFAMLLHNLEINGAGNVRAIQAAMVDAPGPVTLFEAPDGNSGESTIVQLETAPPNTTPVQVDGLSFASLLEFVDPARTRLVKIDAEGAEWLILQGMDRCFERLHPKVEIVVETAPDHLQLFGKTFSDLRSLMARHGFKPYLIDNDYTADGYIRRSTPKPPRRLNGDILRNSDLVFSRTDAPLLA